MFKQKNVSLKEYCSSRLYRKILLKFKLLKHLGIGTILLILIIIMSTLSPHFLKWANLSNIMLHASIATIVAAGVTCVILTGGIDLSVGSIVAVSAVCLGKVIHLGMDYIGTDASQPEITLIVMLGITIAILAGIVCGLINGFLVARCKIPSFIATLGMMSVARSLALIIAEGKTLYNFPAQVRWFGNGHIGLIHVPVIMALIVILALAYILAQTRFGRHIYAIGGNREAVNLSGINVDWVEIRAYMISGFLAAIGAIILVGRLNAAQPIAGISYELDAIAAAVIGGTSLTGGIGGVFGTLTGALIMGISQNGMTLLNISSYSQRLIIGLMITIAVFLDQIRQGNISLQHMFSIKYKPVRK